MALRFKQYWEDRVYDLRERYSLDVVALTAMAVSFLISDNVRPEKLALTYVPDLAYLFRFGWARIAGFIVEWLVCMVLIEGILLYLIDFHDKRLFARKFSEDERQYIEMASNIAFDWWSREATEEATERRDELRIENYECEWDELHLSKGFTPLRSDATVESVRQKRQMLAQEYRTIVEGRFANAKLGKEVISGGSEHTDT